MSESQPALPPAAGPAAANLQEYTVSELATAVKRTVETRFDRVRVRGEISRPSFPGSGHCYLRLKDQDAVLDGVVWRSVLPRLSVRPEEGLEVVCTGRLTTYPGKSTYQIVIEAMEVAGEGALLKMIEERRKRLAAEGLFDAARKRPLPYLPAVIGVITSPTGAVIRDILHRLADRFPRHVLIWPVAVQGEAAAAQVAAAIRGFNALDGSGAVPRPELLIVARGGGSLEDLMPFNEETVVRAAAASAIPLIAAVGHETDTTLIDHAADWRAPTPTAAAERAVPVRAELMADLLDREQRLGGALQRCVAEARTRLDGLARGLGAPERLIEERAQRLDERAERLGLAFNALIDGHRGRLAEAWARTLHPRAQIERARMTLEDRVDRLRAALAGTGRAIDEGARRGDDLARRLRRCGEQAVDRRREALLSLTQLLDSLSYQRVLERGFAMVLDGEGHAVTAAAAVHPGDALRLRFHDGETPAVAGAGAAPRPARARPAPAGGGQGRLL